MPRRDRHLHDMDHAETVGLVILALGVIGGLLAIGAALLPHSLDVDVSSMGAYAAIFVIVGLSTFLRGD